MEDPRLTLRNPFPAPGRLNIFEQVWRNLNNYVRTLTQGSQRPLISGKLTGTSYSDIWERNFDEEIEERPIRNIEVAEKLIWSRFNGPICWPAIRILANQLQASDDGDDYGHTIAKTLDDNETPIDPEIYKILMRVRKEVLKPSVVLPLIYDFIAYGDAFSSLKFNIAKRQIEGLLKLPTFSMFRVETDNGELLGFEQRQNPYDSTPIRFHPLTCIHWRFQQQNLYGMGLFRQAVDLIPRLYRALDMADEAVLAVGINPRVHNLPCSYTDDEIQDYIKRHEARKKKGAITDYYITNEIAITPFGGGASAAPDVSQPREHAIFLIVEIARLSGLPLWMFGLEQGGAQRFQGGPERSYGVLVNSTRAQFTAGLRWVYDLELALHNIPRDKWNYRIVYPKIIVSPYQGTTGQENEADLDGIEDLD